MSNNKLQTLKGFRDFLPQKMTIRNEVIKRLRGVFEKYGFEELQTPSLEYQEVLLGKYGEEAEKLMYLFKDQGGRDVGMKYDLTVPLARVASSYPELPIPFKRYQIQPVWRAENTQKGRYREFYQCDVDTIGSSSPMVDAEIIAVVDESLRVLGFTNYKIKVNSRDVLFAIMEKASIPKNNWLKAIQSIDKLDKKSQDEVKKELIDKKFSAREVKNLFEFLKSAKPDDFLQKTIDLAKKLGVTKNLVFDSNLARGLDYYTGPIFESVVNEPKIGSITGGGRYDNLLKTLGAPDLPATGTTIGLDRVCDVIEELNLWPNLSSTSVKTLVTIFSPETFSQSVELAKILREVNINTELYPEDSAKLEKQLKYADKKGIPYVIILGPEELKNKKIQLKNLKTNGQIETTIENAISLIK
ncbi:MAG: histidine--tRNA ligase [Patescibacteria group bacterium]